ncbi:MAG: RNA polymerase sigma factor RpoD, partial [Oscillospiraceae bacterium]|nr:RNA polymerase sigma factor RpoD [Oscillospiraceae bacterium]
MTKNTEKKITTIQELVEFGKKQNKLTSTEINKFLEEVGFDLEQVEKLYEVIEANNIEVIDIAEEEEEVLTEK